MLLWIKQNSGLITTFGALTLFFSWIATNTFSARYDSLAKVLSAADQNYKLVRRFRDVQLDLENLVARAAYREYLERATGKEPMLNMGKGRVEVAYEAALKSLETTRINARQIHHFEDLTDTYLEKGRALSTTSQFQRVAEIAAKVSKLREDFEAADAAVLASATALSSTSPSERSDADYEAAIKAIESFQDQYKRELLPRLDPIAKKAVELVNELEREIRGTLRKARDLASTTSDIAIWLYVIGTVMILIAQIAEKAAKQPASET